MEHAKQGKGTSIAIFSASNGELFKHVFGTHYTAAYAYKKTQRIASAVHLVTEYVPESEPLRNELRSRALELLSAILAITGGGMQSGASIERIRHRVFELVSLLEVACAAGFISEMNTDILRNEYTELATLLHARERDISSPAALEQDYFDVSEWGADAREYTDRNIKDTHTTRGYAKDIHPNKESKNTHKGQKSDIKDNQKRHIPTGNRQKVILDLVNKKGRINVKDVSSVILDCSEKTLQRELLSLVDQGVLKKEGERRWSTYTLPDAA